MAATWMELMDSRRKSTASAPAAGAGLQHLQESVRKAQEIFQQSRHAEQEARLGVIGLTQRHPLRAIAAIGLAGALAGCLFGYFVAGRPLPEDEEDWFRVL